MTFVLVSEVRPLVSGLDDTEMLNGTAMTAFEPT